MAIVNQVVSGGGALPNIYRAFNVDGSGELVANISADYSNIDWSSIRKIKIPYVFYKAFVGNQTITSVNLQNFQITGSQGYCEYAFYNAFQNCPNIVGADMRSLTRVGSNYYVFYGMFDGCSNLVSMNLDSLLYIQRRGACGCMFRGTGLTSASMPKLEYIDEEQCCEEMFANCLGLTSFSMPNVVNIGIYDSSNACCWKMFANTALSTFKFESVNVIKGQNILQRAFMGCSSLQSLWFYALNTSSFGSGTSQFNNMLENCTNVTVHFPIVVQSVIGSWSDVTGGFGGTNTTVLFDIVTSITGADSNTYTRSEKDSTATATAWKYNGVLYYTSGVSNNTAGVNEPAVGDTIYSDSACTTAVTTISSIA